MASTIYHKVLARISSSICHKVPTKIASSTYQKGIYQNSSSVYHKGTRVASSVYNNGIYQTVVINLPVFWKFLGSESESISEKKDYFLQFSLLFTVQSETIYLSLPN